MTVVDFHNHFYPKGYIDELKRSTNGYASITKDSQGRLLVNYTGDYNVIVGPHVVLDDRIPAMKKCGIDMEVLTLTTPGVEREKTERGLRLARLTNDGFGEIVDKHRDTFAALATLPMQDPEAAVEELERSVNDLGLRGAMIFSNANGKPLDSKEFVPLYEKAEHLGVPLFIHSTSPLNSAYMDDYRLVPLLGFGVDTSLAILRLLFSGIMERVASLSIVATHTGGVFPYLRGRIERGYEMYPECRENISKPPSHYFKKIWLDTVCYSEEVMMSSYSFVGGKKMLLGTDFPHQIHDMDKAVQRVRNLSITEEEKEMILGKNAMELLRL
jgi:aminocarboxymuconate-semialdehyde decarboxylase